MRQRPTGCFVGIMSISVGSTVYFHIGRNYTIIAIKRQVGF